MEINQEEMISNLVRILKHHKTFVDDEKLSTKIKILRSKTISRVDDFLLIGECITRIKIENPLIQELFDQSTRIYIEAIVDRPIKAKLKSFERECGINPIDDFYLGAILRSSDSTTNITYRLVVLDEYVAFAVNELEIKDQDSVVLMKLLLSERLVTNHLLDLDGVTNLVSKEDASYINTCLHFAKRNAKQHLMDSGRFSVVATNIGALEYSFRIKYHGYDGRYLELPNATLKISDDCCSNLEYSPGDMVVMNAKGIPYDKGVLTLALTELNVLSKFIFSQLIENSQDGSQRVLDVLAKKINYASKIS